jgi:2-phospho-L-lactate/phosphoenolpyruvate guanylyltransferase
MARALLDDARAAAARLAAEGCRAMLTMPGDIPRASADEVRQLTAVHKAAPSFSIVPAHDSRGSNAILCSPPDRVPLRFGNDSFRPHLDAARRCGIEPTILNLPGIGLDIDNPLDMFMREKSPTRTWRYLEAQGLVPAPAQSKGHAA